MKIIVKRTGGFAGLTRTWEVRVQEQPDREEWYRLVESLPWPARKGSAVPSDGASKPDEVQSGRPQPDRFVYVVRVARRSITLAEQQLDGPWRELVQRVRKAGVVVP